MLRTRSFIILALIFLAVLVVGALTACNPTGPVVVTATPVVTEEPTAVPTVDPNVPFQAVNLYPWLKDAVLKFHEEQKGVNNPRMIVMPENMDFINNMLVERPNGDEDCGWLPPYSYQHNDGLSIEPAWLCGTWAFAESVYLEPGRYILKMGYDKIRLRPTDGEYWQAGNVTAFPELYTTTGNAFELTSQSLPQTDDDLELIWVIDVERALSMQIRWSHHIEWPSIEGTFVLSQLRVETAPPDFGDDSYVAVFGALPWNDIVAEPVLIENDLD